MMDVVCLGLAVESVAPADPDPVAAIPGDVSELSASRLDPPISPAASRCQFP